MCERVLTFLENISPESNSVIDEWKIAGIEAESAFFTQGLIQLRNNYCKRRRCLDCRIGSRLISLGKSLGEAEKVMLEPRPGSPF